MSPTTVAELLAVLCNTEAFDITKDDPNASLMVESRIPLPNELVALIDNSQFLPPMVCAPTVPGCIHRVLHLHYVRSHREMPREDLYCAAIANMRKTVNMLADMVNPPVRVPYKHSFVFRYAEKTPEQAIVQKLARIATTLSGTHVLMTYGLVQEQAALQRILHELHEDVIFLAYSVIYQDLTPLHQKYLDAFYEEEFDADTPMESSQKRPMVKRSQIQAYIANREGAAHDPSTGIGLARTITKAYSGYVHAASPQIMDMYGGNPPHYHVEGMIGTRRHIEHRLDLWNYYYRSILAFGVAAKAFGDQELFDQIHAFTAEFECRANKNYSPKP